MRTWVASLDVLFSVLLLYLAKQLLSPKRVRRRLPPGPPGLPFIKNLFDWPKSKAWETFRAWGKQYGDVAYVSVRGQGMLIINSYDEAIALLHSKGDRYSERPEMYFLNEIVGWGKCTTLLPEGHALKKHRRLFANQLGSRVGLKRYEHLVYARTRNFVHSLMQEPSQDMLLPHLRYLSAAVILDVTYGYRVKEGRDDLVDLAERVGGEFSLAATPNNFLVDTYPILARLPSWLPGLGFQKMGTDMHARLMRFMNQPYEFARELLAKGIDQPSVVASILQDEDLSAEDEDVLKYMAMTMYSAGAETVVIALHSFIRFMTLYPEVQAKAQAEIDTVVGSTRLPHFSDRHQLPYVDAVLKEVYRFGMILPMGVQHRLRIDDIHHDYVVPKNTWVFPNIWAMTRDLRSYRNPDVFDPSRFLGEKPELDPRSLIFGFGRRICPGRFFADGNLFLACSMILATISITKTLDPEGNEITPPIEYSDGLLTRGKEFHFSMKARSALAEALLKAETIR